MWHMDFEDVSLTAAFCSVKGEVQCANASRAHIFFASSQVVPVAWRWQPQSKRKAQKRERERERERETDRDREREEREKERDRQAQHKPHETSHAIKIMHKHSHKTNVHTCFYNRHCIKCQNDWHAITATLMQLREMSVQRFPTATGCCCSSLHA